MGICASSPAPGPGNTGPGEKSGSQRDMDVTKGGSMVLNKKTAPTSASSGGTDADMGVINGGSQLMNASMLGKLGNKNTTLNEFNSGGQRQPPPIHEPITCVHELGIGPDGKSMTVPITFGYRSIQGRNPRPPHKPNQDNLLYSLKMGDAPDINLFGVLDGHGPFGEAASYFVFKEFAKTVMNNPEFAAGNHLDAYTAGFKGTRAWHGRGLLYACVCVEAGASPAYQTCLTVLEHAVSLPRTSTMPMVPSPTHHPSSVTSSHRPLRPLVPSFSPSLPHMFTLPWLSPFSPPPSSPLTPPLSLLRNALLLPLLAPLHRSRSRRLR